MTPLEQFCPSPWENGKPNLQYEKVYGKFGWKRWARYLKEPKMYYPALKQIKRIILRKLSYGACKAR